MLDPEWIVHSREQYYAKNLNGTSFMAVKAYSNDINATYNSNSEYDVFWVGGQKPVNPHGEIGWKTLSDLKGNVLSTGFKTVIASTAPRPDLIAKMIDLQYSEEMMILVSYGIEGDHWHWTEDRRIDYSDEIKNAGDDVGSVRAKYGIWSSGSRRPGFIMAPLEQVLAVPDPSSFVPMWDGKTVERQDAKLFYDRVDGTESIWPNEGGHHPPIQLNEEQRDLESDIMTPINTYIDESVLRFVTGDMDLDDYDEFVAQINKLGDWRKIKDIKNKLDREFRDRWNY